jgi:hypothetical protein
MKPLRLTLPLALLSALVLAACGESKEDKAVKSVCSARADISKQISHLKSLTPTTATVEDVQSSLSAIGAALGKIKDAQGDLRGDRKQQVQNANQTFESQLKSITSSAVKSLSLGDAKTQLASALQQLESAYKQALAPIDCS